MNLAIILLKTGETLISSIEQMEYEPKVHLIKPHLISGKTKVTLSPWPSYTEDEHILLQSDTLLTVCEPIKSIEAAYLKKVGKRLEELTTTAEPVMLNEETEESLEQVDEYEPRYIEEPIY